MKLLLATLLGLTPVADDPAPITMTVEERAALVQHIENQAERIRELQKIVDKLKVATNCA